MSSLQQLRAGSRAVYTLTHMHLILESVGSLPCIQGRRSPLPYSSLQHANVIKRDPNYLSSLHRQSYLHHFFWGEENRHPTCTSPSRGTGPAPYPNHPWAARRMFQYSGTRFNPMATPVPKKLLQNSPYIPCPQSRGSARCLWWLCL